MTKPALISPRQTEIFPTAARHPDGKTVQTATAGDVVK